MFVSNCLNNCLSIFKFFNTLSAYFVSNSNNLNLSLIDDAVTVTYKEAFEVLQVLLQEEGILGGSSTGTLVAGAIKWCQKQTEPKKKVTFICDTGNKYLSKAFNKSWLHDNNLLNQEKEGNLSDLINRRADKGEMITVSPNNTLLIAYNRMRSADISQIPVLDGEDLLGILESYAQMEIVVIFFSVFSTPNPGFLFLTYRIISR